MGSSKLESYLGIYWKILISPDSDLEMQKKKLTATMNDVEDKRTHSGYNRYWMEETRFSTNTSYEGEWNAVGMDGMARYFYPHKIKTFQKVLVNNLNTVVPEHLKHNLVKYRVFSVPFLTDSSYAGEWDAVGLSGSGNFMFPHRVENEGDLVDGMFHGDGVLTYPMGQKAIGVWDKGRLISFKFKFGDGLEFSDPWKYCIKPDRRFLTSVLEGLQPNCKSFLTNEQPTRKIPEGCYDTGDGFYNPKTRCVMSAYEPEKILRVPNAAEHTWILENCRKAWDEPTKFRPDLYEDWVSGRKKDTTFAGDDQWSRYSSLSSYGTSISMSFSAQSSASDMWNSTISVHDRLKSEIHF